MSGHFIDSAIRQFSDSASKNEYHLMGVVFQIHNNYLSKHMQNEFAKHYK